MYKRNSSQTLSLMDHFLVILWLKSKYITQEAWSPFLFNFGKVAFSYTCLCLAVILLLAIAHFRVHLSLSIKARPGGSSHKPRFLLDQEKRRLYLPQKCAQRIYLQCRQSCSVYLAEIVLLPRKQNAAYSVSLLYRTTRLLLVLKKSKAAPDCHVIQSRPIQTKRALKKYNQ